MVTFYHTVRFKSVCQAYYLSIYLYLSIYESNHIRLSLSIQAYIPIYLSVVVTTYPHLSIYLSIRPHKSTYHSVCPSFPTHLSIYLSISRLHLCVCACLSIHSFIYLAAAYPCIILLSIYVPIHYRSTYVSVHPSRHRPNNPFLCVLSMHPHQCTYSPLRVCLSISIGSSPTTHASMISIGSVTDCSERSKLAIPTLVT